MVNAINLFELEKYVESAGKQINKPAVTSERLYTPSTQALMLRQPLEHINQK